MEKVIIGIYVSKIKLDLCVRIGDKISQELVLPNTISDLTKFFNKLLKERTVSAVLLCCEYSGHYVYPLCCVCDGFGLSLWLENPYQIKHSLWAFIVARTIR